MKRNIASRGRLVIGSTSLPAILSCVLIGCAAGAGAPDGRALRQLFPEQADEVLRGRSAFAWSGDGFEPAAAEGALSGRLPRRGDGAIHLDLPDGLGIEVREVGARGEGALAEDAVVYEREGGASFWVAAGKGYEEWLSLEADAVRRDAPVAAWEVEGAALWQRGEAIEIAGSGGEARMRVIAPIAYAEGGRRIGTRLSARGTTIELWVDAEAERVLVDPGWLPMKSSMSGPRGGHSAMLLPDGRVLVFGGLDALDDSLPEPELFDPGSRTWTAVGSKRPDRRGYTAILLPEGSALGGRVLVTGGTSPEGDVSSDADLFDPESGALTPIEPMIKARSGHTATLLADGRILIVGSELEGAEIFSPHLETWMEVPPPLVAYTDHEATLLNDGRVLITGVADITGDPKFPSLAARAELFDPHAPPDQMWTAVEWMSDARQGYTTTLLQDGRVLIAGGQNGAEFHSMTELFNPTLGAFTPAPPMTTARSGHTATRLPDGRVLIAGGFSDGSLSTHSVELFDPVTQKWTSGARMNNARSSHAATLLPDGRIVVTGGFDGLLNTFSSVELFDPTSPGWTTVGSMSFARNAPSMTLLPDGRVLVAGGVAFEEPIGSSVELFEPSARTWTPGPPMSTHRFQHAATPLSDGRVLVAGGMDDPGGDFVPGMEGDSLPHLLSSAEIFAPVTDAWTPAQPMTVARYGHTLTQLVDGRILAAGGTDSLGQRLSSAELLDLDTGKSTPIEPMSAPRAGHTATLLLDGSVLVAGGWAAPINTESPGGISSAELFEPESETWEPVAPMATARAGHTATRLSDGRVLVAGGGSPLAIDDTAELFDPASRTWSSVPPMSAPRGRHTATALSNGGVLMVGAFAGDAVEIFDPGLQGWTLAPPMSTGRVLYHSAALLPDGSVLVAGGVVPGQSGVVSSAEVFSLQPTGTACISAHDCASGYCTDGVCCNAACNLTLCEACSEYRGAARDGTCTPLHPECSPFACSPVTGSCANPCASIKDCEPGHACDPSGDCVPFEPPPSFVDDSSCALPAAGPEAPDSSPSPATGLLLLTAAAVLRRRRRG